MGLPMTIEMAKKARELSATGKNVISLSLGEPDFDTPEFIKDAASQAMVENYTHYMPVPGFSDVRESIAAKFKRDNGIEYTAEQIVISTGAKQSLLNIFLALVNPGEEVIIPAPYWVSYMDQAVYCGAEVKVLPTTMESGFKITADELESAITPKSKVLIFSSPNNPCGAIYSKEELARSERDKKHRYIPLAARFAFFSIALNSARRGRYARPRVRIRGLVNPYARVQRNHVGSRSSMH